MKDFDFDELDRAVNSVLAPKDQNADDTAQTNDTQQDAVDQTEQDAPSTTDDAAQPVAVQNDDAGNDDASDGSDVIAVHTPEVELNDSTEAPVIEDIVPAPETEQPAEAESAPEDSTEDTEHTEDAPQETVESGAENTDQPVEDNAEGVDSTRDEAPSTEGTSLAAIPVKRGRFMDMVPPTAGSDTNKRPIPSRGGVTLTPSADFSTEESTPEQHTDTQQPVVDVATPVVESDVEPEVTADTTLQDNIDPSTSDSLEAAEETNSETSDTATDDSTPAESVASAVDTTPFIADVPVDKRPLNDLSGDTPQGDATSDTTPAQPEDASADPTLSNSLPKEYDKDIMAVEANETVGEHDETHSDDATVDTTVAPSTSLTDTAPAAAMAATTAEPHPMFDTSTLGHTDAHGHHTSKMSWAVVGGSLFIVGAALGVLYFLYGQG